MITFGIVIFPNVEELDFVAPFEVLSYANKVQPNSTKVLLIAPSLEPVHAFNGLRILPDVTFENCPTLDILLFPGGKGRMTWMKETSMQNFIQKHSKEVTYLTSVCTGAFFLAEAGVLKGKEATTYYTAFDELAAYGVNVVSSKVVRDGKIITAAGVSSGLELGFYLLRELFGAPLAQEVSERIEYNIDITTI
ncbi:DJ-1/PfpI family protein [Sulfurospirillum diekertiae]|uniref:Isonitrile hydratase n=1 Tax=Sulfurospirillum diekertiae TaxID=1854492 RepID=A0A1Y0HIV2_9BACT|nr:DJ-1/PfpI family protein [Sulfurospirillum diekertiae]ARU47972.1 Isonitrile hydratase [Sulfurospirillum diekertiae]ASC92819.1 Isonitrile hydratase [Sulfurospirillum diekertiae]